MSKKTHLVKVRENMYNNKINYIYIAKLVHVELKLIRGRFKSGKVRDGN